MADFGVMVIKAGAGYTLQFSALGMTPALAGSFNVTPAAALSLVLISGPPANVSVGSSFQLIVAAEDVYGNVATSYGGNLIVGLAGNHGRGRLRGTVIASASGGLATFSKLTENTVGKGYILTVAGTGLIPATTPPFNVSLAPKVSLKLHSAHALKVRTAAKPRHRK